jgi:hypothetical protein
MGQQQSCSKAAHHLELAGYDLQLRQVQADHKSSMGRTEKELQRSIHHGEGGQTLGTRQCEVWQGGRCVSPFQAIGRNEGGTISNGYTGD